MKGRVIIVVGLLLVCMSTLGFAQELSQITVPSWYNFLYNIKMGKHAYYMPTNQLNVLGYDFSSKRLFTHDTYVSWVTPWMNVTYTASPDGVYNTDGAMLITKSNRGDLEIKSGYTFNPTVTFEHSIMDLYSWKMVDAEIPTLDSDGNVAMDKEGKAITEVKSVLAHNRDSIQRIYGGAGISFETPVTNALTFKAAGTYRFINQNGWEGSAALAWTPGKFAKGEPHILFGVVGHEVSYSWGNSRNYGLMAEIGIAF